MRRITYEEYPHDGKIIDVNNSSDYLHEHFSESQNIPYEKLMNHYKEYLNKNAKYYIYCSGGQKSKRAVQILSYYGYNVIQITK